MNVSVFIVPIHTQRSRLEGVIQRAVLIKKFCPSVNDYVIDFPAGLINPGETPEEAAKRKLFEETGLKIENIFGISPPIYNSVGLSDESTVVVRAIVSGDPTNSNAEGVEIMLVLQDDARKILVNPKNKFGAKCWIELDNFVSASYK